MIEFIFFHQSPLFISQFPRVFLALVKQSVKKKERVREQVRWERNQIRITSSISSHVNIPVTLHGRVRDARRYIGSPGCSTNEIIASLASILAVRYASTISYSFRRPRDAPINRSVRSFSSCTLRTPSRPLRGKIVFGKYDRSPVSTLLRSKDSNDQTIRIELVRSWSWTRTIVGCDETT